MGFLGDALGTTRGDNDQNQNVDTSQFRTAEPALTDLSAQDRAQGDATTAYLRPITDASVSNQQDIGATSTAASGRSFADYSRLMNVANNDALNYDSPEQMDRVRQQAAGNANAAFDAAETSRQVGLERMGVNPNSGAFVGGGIASNVGRAAAVAGSMNSATADLRDRAIALRSGAAGMNQSAAQGFSGIGLNAGSAAVTTAAAGRNAGLPYYAAAAAPLATTAGLDANLYGTAVRDAGQTLDYNMKSKNIVSNQVLGLEGMYTKSQTG